MKLSKFKTVCYTDTAELDNELSNHVNNKWTLHGPPRTILDSDGSIQHFQTLKKMFDFGSPQGKELFNQAAELNKES